MNPNTARDSMLCQALIIKVYDDDDDDNFNNDNSTKKYFTSAG